jgi:hypothetical protein
MTYDELETARTGNTTAILAAIRKTRELRMPTMNEAVLNDVLCPCGAPLAETDDADLCRVCGEEVIS